MCGSDRGGHPQLLQNIVHSLHELCPVAKQGVRPPVARREDVAWDRHDLPALFERHARRDERAAFLRRFHDDDSDGQAADDAVAQRKVGGQRTRTGRKLADDGAVPRNRVSKLAMFGRIHHVGARPENGDRQAAAGQRSTVRGAVDAARHAAHHRNAAPGEALAELLCNVARVTRGGPCAYQRDCHARQTRGISAIPDDGRRVVNAREPGRILRVSPQHGGQTGAFAALDCGERLRSYRRQPGAESRRLLTPELRQSVEESLLARPEGLPDRNPEPRPMRSDTGTGKQRQT